MSKHHIPHDLIYCILARLSVKDLLKLKCVSKLWLITIESPEFVKFHVINHSFDSKSQKLICANWRLDSCPSNVSGFLSFPEMFGGDQKSKPPEEIRCPGLSYEKNNIVGTSRGILCIQYTKGGIYLCNPWIKECKKLPRCYLQSFPRHRQWFNNVYGFGYDELNDDFKVVKLSGIACKTHPSLVTNEGNIYSLKSNKWYPIGNIPYWFDGGKPGFFFNHSLHWIFGGFRRESFLSVDIRTGKYTLLLLPEELRNDKNLNFWDLGEFKGCLCISQGVISGFAIWFMKDYGVEDSWTKLKIFVSDTSFWNGRLMRYTKTENGSAQLVFTLSGVFYVFDFHQLKLYSLANVIANNYFFSIESLVPLCHSDKSESSSCSSSNSNKSSKGLKKRKRC